MGIGDDLIATGLARGAAERGKRIAFGNGEKIKFGPYSAMIFKNNPNICWPGEERANDIEWISYYKGNRGYNSSGVGKWIWNYNFRAQPGQLFFDESEDIHDDDRGMVLLEPNVPNKPCAPNKQWPVERWKQLADALLGAGFEVRQFEYGGRHRVAPPIQTPTFRNAASLIKSARLAILPEGGLHHAAAAVGTPAVVLFGGFVPPAVLGYDGHSNLTGGATACGSYAACRHCSEAMAAIRVDDVLEAAGRFLLP